MSNWVQPTTLTQIQMATMNVWAMRKVGVPKKRAKPSALSAEPVAAENRIEMRMRQMKPGARDHGRPFAAPSS